MLAGKFLPFSYRLPEQFQHSTVATSASMRSSMNFGDTHFKKYWVGADVIIWNQLFTGCLWRNVLLLGSMRRVQQN
jgi:hypothetical protein